MIDLNLTIGDIFDYERSRWNDSPHCLGEKKEEIVQRFLYKAKEFIISIPDVSYIKDEGDNYYKNRSENAYEYLKNRTLDIFPEEYRFEVGNKIFSYLDHTVIHKKSEEYPFFLFLKTTQYENDIFKLKDFLDYHLKNNYKKESELCEFLENLLLNYEEYIPNKVKVIIRKWVNENSKLLIRNELLNSPPLPIIETKYVVIKNENLAYKQMGKEINIPKTKLDSNQESKIKLESSNNEFPLRPKDKSEEILLLHCIIKYLKNNPNEDFTSGINLSRVAHLIYGRNYTKAESSVYKKFSNAPTGIEKNKTQKMKLSIKDLKEKLKKVELEKIALLELN